MKKPKLALALVAGTTLASIGYAASDSTTQIVCKDTGPVSASVEETGVQSGRGGASKYGEEKPSIVLCSAAKIASRMGITR